MAHENEVRLGTSVRFRYGAQTVTGTVKEERGPIGIGGRRLYLIEFKPDPYYESLIELPADQLEVLHPSLN